MADFLSIDMLYARVGSVLINGYFDDSFNGTITDELPIVDEILMFAEGELTSRLLRHYPGDVTDPESRIRILIDNDPTLRMHAVSVALQYAAERRPQFTDADGVGPYKAQYERAIKYFETLSKGTIRSRGETQAGKGANTGGNISPKPPVGTAAQFVFAASRDAKSGHGGFIIPLALAAGEMLRTMVTIV